MKLDLRYVAAGAAIGALVSLGIMPMASAAAAHAEATRGAAQPTAAQPAIAPPTISQPGISPVIQDRIAQWARSFAAGDPTSTTDASQAEFNAVRTPGLTPSVSDFATEGTHHCYGFSLGLTQPTITVNGIANPPTRGTTPVSVLVLAYPSQPSTYEYFVGNRACQSNLR